VLQSFPNVSYIVRMEPEFLSCAFALTISSGFSDQENIRRRLCARPLLLYNAMHRLANFIPWSFPYAET